MVIKLEIKLGENIQSFKNKKRSILDSKTGQQRTLTPKKTKDHMNRLEQLIVSDLLSKYQTEEPATDLECRRRLLTVSLGLCDDSLKVVPEFSFGVEYVEKGNEGVLIEVEEFKAIVER
jgi:hypothetical protein